MRSRRAAPARDEAPAGPAAQSLVVWHSAQAPFTQDPLAQGCVELQLATHFPPWHSPVPHWLSWVHFDAERLGAVGRAAPQSEWVRQAVQPSGASQSGKAPPQFALLRQPVQATFAGSQAA